MWNKQEILWDLENKNLENLFLTMKRELEDQDREKKKKIAIFWKSPQMQIYMTSVLVSQ